MSATMSRAVAASQGDPLTEAVELTKRLKLPHIRRHLVELVPTARAQRWDHAELIRVLLAEEAAGRDATNLRTRRQRAGFPAGKTLHDWDAGASCIPRPTQDALTSLEWVGRRENVCICGPSGTGKSHFCEALGQAAVEAYCPGGSCVQPHSFDKCFDDYPGARARVPLRRRLARRRHRPRLPVL